MDFTTRSNTQNTKVLYGQKSDQYRWSVVLSNAKNQMIITNSLVLTKKCKMETIKVIFDYRPITDKVYSKTKKHYPLDSGVCKKEKKSDMDIYIGKFIDYDLFDMLQDGYIIADEFQKPEKVIRYWFSCGQSDGGLDVNYVYVNGKWHPYSEITTDSDSVCSWEDAQLVATSTEDLPTKFSDYSRMLIEEHRAIFG